MSPNCCQRREENSLQRIASIQPDAVKLVSTRLSRTRINRERRLLLWAVSVLAAPPLDPSPGNLIICHHGAATFRPPASTHSEGSEADTYRGFYLSLIKAKSWSRISFRPDSWSHVKLWPLKRTSKANKNGKKMKQTWNSKEFKLGKMHECVPAGGRNGPGHPQGSDSPPSSGFKFVRFRSF